MCFVSQDVVQLGRRSRWAWETNKQKNLCSLCWKKSSIDVSCCIQLINGTAEFKNILTDFLLAGSGERGVKVFHDDKKFTYFSLQFYQFCSHVFWHTVVRPIQVKDCYVFLKNWPLHHYIMIACISDAFLCFVLFEIN